MSNIINSFVVFCGRGFNSEAAAELGLSEDGASGAGVYWDVFSPHSKSENKARLIRNHDELGIWEKDYVLSDGRVVEMRHDKLTDFWRFTVFASKEAYKNHRDSVSKFEAYLNRNRE